MVHIIINPSLSAAIGYNLFLNPPKFAEVSAILEPANSTRTDYSICTPVVFLSYFSPNSLKTCFEVACWP